MSYLIFSSYDVGGWPFKMAEILNRHGIRTYYLSIQEKQSGHDSRQFHYGYQVHDWDISSFARDLSFPRGIRSLLRFVRDRFHITDCFATGWKAYVLKQAGISYTYWSFGADLDQLCFTPLWKKDYPAWKKMIRYPMFTCMHPKPVRMEARMSLRDAGSLLIAPYQMDACKELGLDNNFSFLPHILSMTGFRELLEKKRESKKKICEKIDASFFLFSSARHIWCGSQSHLKDNKGNDIILKAYKRYLEISDDRASKLVLVEKGDDVGASKALAEQMGIGHLLVWVKEMPRGDLEDHYRGASICFGQFTTPCLTYAVLEPLAYGTPCISYYDKESIRSLNLPYYDELPPVTDSRDPDQMAAYMYKLLSDRECYDELVQKSWQWTWENCSEEKFVETFTEIFENRMAS